MDGARCEQSVNFIVLPHFFIFINGEQAVETLVLFSFEEALYHFNDPRPDLHCCGVEPDGAY